MTVLGIDISHWQQSTPSLVGLGFVVVKVSEGTTEDPKHDYHSANVRRAGKMLMNYCFSRDDVSLDAQAEFFVKHADKDAIALAVDNEGPHSTTTAQTRYLINRIRAWDALIRGNSIRPVMLYMSESGFQEAGQDEHWVANWDRTPHHPYLIWQYHGGPLDKDRYEGTLSQLRVELAPIPFAPESDVQGEPTVKLAAADRAIRAEAGHGIFTTPAKNAANLIRNTKDGEVIDLIGSEGDGATGFQCVWLGDRAGYISNLDIAQFVASPPPVVDTTPYDQDDIDAQVNPLKAQVASLTTDLTKSQAALTKAQADLANAAKAERERIAQAEKDRINGI